MLISHERKLVQWEKDGGGDSRIDGWMDREIIWVVACGR